MGFSTWRYNGLDRYGNGTKHGHMVIRSQENRKVRMRRQLYLHTRPGKASMVTKKDEHCTYAFTQPYKLDNCTQPSQFHLGRMPPLN